MELPETGREADDVLEEMAADGDFADLARTLLNDVAYRIE